jgi:hypothetical protein
MRGLDPRIHLFFAKTVSHGQNSFSMMDGRVKPGHDGDNR